MTTAPDIPADLVNPPQPASPKIALITGMSGQDGASLAELLLAKDYIVHGVKRRTSRFSTDRIDRLYQGPQEDQRRFILYHGDLTDSSTLLRIVQQVAMSLPMHCHAHRA